MPQSVIWLSRDLRQFLVYGDEITQLRRSIVKFVAVLKTVFIKTSIQDIFFVAPNEMKIVRCVLLWFYKLVYYLTSLMSLIIYNGTPVIYIILSINILVYV